VRVVESALDNYVVAAEIYCQHTHVHWQVGDGVERADKDHRFDYIRLDVI